MKTRMIYDSQWAIDDCDNEDDFYDFHFDDEVRNLNKELDNKILVIAELHLWNSVKSGFIILDRQNLSEILYVGSGDYKKVYVKGNDVIMEDTHHDGNNIYKFRLIKDINNIHNLTNKIYVGNFSSKDISRYTTSLAKMVKEIYGWK